MRGGKLGHLRSKRLKPLTVEKEHLKMSDQVKPGAGGIHHMVVLPREEGPRMKEGSRVGKEAGWEVKAMSRAVRAHLKWQATVYADAVFPATYFSAYVSGVQTAWSAMP